MALFEDCKISKDKDGCWNAASIDGVMTVPPEGKTKMFLRNFIKFPVGHELSDEKKRVRILIGELDGVRCYLLNSNPPQIILTKQDLYF